MMETAGREPVPSEIATRSDVVSPSPENQSYSPSLRINDPNARMEYQRLNQNLSPFEQALDNIRNADLSSLRDTKVSSEINDQRILNVRKKLINLIGNNPENLNQDQLKLINSINKLFTYNGPSDPENKISAEEVIASVLELVSKKLKQGNSPACTAAAGGQLLMNHRGVGHFSELLTNIIVDGSHGELRSNESGYRREASSACGKYPGASIAECIFRSAVMELSNRKLEGISEGVTIVYSDPAHGNESQGVSYIYDDKTKKLIGTYQGMHAEGWLLAHETMLDCAIEYKQSTKDGGNFAPSDIVAAMSKKGGTHECIIAYDETGLHTKHDVVFHKIENGRVFFSNPHDLDDDNFHAKSATHKLEEAVEGVEGRLESMTIEEFEDRLFSAGIIHIDKPAGFFRDTNKFGHERFENALAYYRENGVTHVVIHEGPNFTEMKEKNEVSKNRVQTFMERNNSVSQDLTDKTYYSKQGFSSQSELEAARDFEGQYAWDRLQKERFERLLKLKRGTTLRVNTELN